MAKIEAGLRINDYILDEKIGGGAFGEVWLAHHHVWADDRVAIKIPTDADYIRNLQREGTVIHGLRHGNIVRALGLDPYADPAYFIMEWVPGTSLRSLIQDKKLSPEQAVAILRQVLAGLAVAHAAGVIHRDMKPENILVHENAASAGFTTEGCVKIADFGLGRAAAQTMAGSIQFSRDVSQDGRIAGTLDYMAPEQRRGGQIDARADLYACGVLLYEMLTGELPEGHEVPSGVNAKSPKHLDEVFRKAYGKLDSRYASAADFASALVPPVPPPAVVRPDQTIPPPVGAPAALKTGPFVNSLGMAFVPIPAGWFMMGSPEGEEGHEADETLHKVTLTKLFLIGKHPVTRGQFAAFADETGYDTDAEKEGWAYGWTGSKWDKVQGASWRNPTIEQADDHPVVSVSWNDAIAFIRWLNGEKEKALKKWNYRLTNEAEWEYACRAGTKTPFYTGATINTDQANYDGNHTYGKGVKGVYRKTTTPVGSFPANGWGLFDMHGNAWQWCRDAFGEYPKGAVKDPAGPSQESSSRVVRGGSWGVNPRGCRSANRGGIAPDNGNGSVGFRVCLDFQ